MDQTNKPLDRRIKNTRNAIRGAFLRLLGEKPVGKITVSLLCEQAGVNRSTFYMHYRDVYELLEGMKEELLEKIDLLCQELSSREYDNYTTMRRILDTICENRMLLKYLLLLEPDTAFIRRAKEKTMSLFFHNVARERELSPVKVQELEPALIFLANGFFAMYTDWLNRDCADDIDEFARLAARLTGSCLDGLHR